MPLASVWRAAKPTTRPSTAEEARMPVASLLIDGICAARQRDADQDDHREDQPAHEPQPRGGDRRQLADAHGLA